MTAPESKTQVEVAEEGIAQLRINWLAAAAGHPIQHVNQAVSQIVGDEFFIALFSLPPPVLLGSREEQIDQLRGISEVQPTCIVRFVVTEETMRNLVEALSDNLRRFDKIRKDNDINKG